MDGPSTNRSRDYARTFDPMGRLLSMATTHTFAYDYRSGGLSIQEYEVPVEATPPSLSNLRTEFIRGQGMGGGVGGMVYSIKGPSGNPPSEIGNIICSHANHRGDIIARSNKSGSLTYFALYEAYGTRPYEWGDGVTGDPDRQKANTKEEEKDLGLLNEGMRYRDLETGTFLTRDPIGYADGPNIYCYVRCNPITRFDPLGLKLETATESEAQQYITDYLQPVSTWEYGVQENDGGGFNIVITGIDGSAKDRTDNANEWISSRLCMGNASNLSRYIAEVESSLEGALYELKTTK